MGTGMVVTEKHLVNQEVRIAIRVRCPDCGQAVYVRNGGRIPVVCVLCHRWYGPGRQPIIEVDVGKA